MTDKELIARLREDVFYGDERLHNLSRHNPLHMEAADRIEALVKQCEGLAQAAMNNGQALILAEDRIKGLEAAGRAYRVATRHLKPCPETSANFDAALGNKS